MYCKNFTLLWGIVGTHCVCPQNKPYPILTTDTQCVPTVNSLKLLQIFGFTVGENYIHPDVTMIIWGKCDLPLHIILYNYTIAKISRNLTACFKSSLCLPTFR